ncbi:uncharacterized protein LOC143045842 [Mytilus galloprovincialis]|uniref:uncharacterized protein LOC143045842 n=1 Tax=Mytilus galloprovincialis TaxID=29158 RepID=UPI003F7B9939
MSQYDTEKFCQPPDPDLICCICQCVLQSPVESPCRHVFCNVCITTWLNNHRNCPTCRRRVKKRQLKPVLPIVQNMINRLLMFCDFKDNGCAETVMLEIYVNHVEGCGYRKLKCRFNRCDKMILKKDKDQHENQVCEFREKLCIGRCGLMIPVCVYDTHDCYEELQKFNQEKSELVDKLQEKVKELNALTQKLQKEVDRLKQQLARNRWNLPDAWGTSWDPSDSDYNDSMYNYLSGSSYSDDQDSHFSQPDLVLTATSHPTATNTTTTTTTSSSADNGGFREYVIYPSRRPTTPVIHAPWPRYETRSSRYVYDIRSPSPNRNATDAHLGTDQALDLSHHTHQEQLPMGEGIFHRLSAGISDTAPSTNVNLNNIMEYIPTPINNNHSNTGSSTATDSSTSLNLNEGDHDSQDESNNNDDLSHHSDHTVYSLSDSDSDHTPTRWWRSSRSSMSHHSDHQSDIQRSSRSRSHSFDSNRSGSRGSHRSRSLSYDSDESRFWSRYHSHMNRSRSILSERSGSYDFHRRSRSYNYSRSRSRSFDSNRSRSRSYDNLRRPHVRRRWASSRSSQSGEHYRTWSRSRSMSIDRLSRSRSMSIDRLSRSRSRSIDRISRSRSRSRSMSRSIERLSRSRSRSLDHVRSISHSDESLSSSSTLRSYMSRSGSRSSRSCTPDSDRSETPVDETHDRHISQSSPAHENDNENLNQSNKTAGNSRHLNITTDIDSTETDSDAGYNFKRRRSKNSNCSDSGIGTESSNTDLSKNQNSDTRDSNVNNGASSDDRKRKTSVIDCDIDTKRMRNQDNNNGEQSDSDTSWVPSANDRQTDDTISDEASSGSSYDVEVPKTVLELIDEVDSEGTDDTWSPN